MRRVVPLICLVLAGCGSAAEAPNREPAARTPEATAPGRQEPAVRRARCPRDAANCAEVTGRVLYVEAVDPDGDGDAHYVIAGGRITAPGISAIDVRRGLRPRRLPRVGDLVSAAGPVYTGSYGQRQIEAVEVHHQRD